jgi:hypothetical protein
MQKFYRGSWYELANKWSALMHANSTKMMKLYKVGADGAIYPKSVYPSDWKSTFGYDPIVSSSSEEEQNDIKSMQKFQFVVSQSPNNSALKKIAQKRQLGMLDLTIQEMREVEDAEDKLIEQQEAQMMGGGPEVQGMMAQAQDQMKQLQGLTA